MIGTYIVGGSQGISLGWENYWMDEWMENLNVPNLNLVHWLFTEHSDVLNRNTDIMKMELERHVGNCMRMLK